ncbi:MAG: SIS domain-containing protein [Patescibacteria group bacterium]|jgi:glucose/mannose-6-phosphate isomerase
MVLDTDDIYKKFDPDDIAFGVENLPEQVKIAWHDTRDLILPRGYSEVSNIVVAGMGGSALGPHMLKALFADRLDVPFEIVGGYTLPKYVSKDTLVILSSYSGTTEEVIACAEQAKDCRAKIAVVAAGGVLADMASSEGWPAYIFEPGDLAKQPRYGTGFSLIGILGILERAGLVKVKEAELQAMMSAMGEVIDTCAVDVPTAENPAKEVALALANHNVIIVGAEHLAGNAHIMANQLNESAKQFATYQLLPELNHHFLEGLKFPSGLAENTTVVLLESDHYHERTQKRCKITADIFEKKGISVIDYGCRGASKMDEVGEVLQFGSYLGLYLALLNGVVTTDTATVFEFKKRMDE